MAGLMAARVLSRHYDRVYILERDAVNDFQEARKGQPHARHTHVLLAKGLEVMNHYFPGFSQELKDANIDIVDFAQDARWLVNNRLARQHQAGLSYVLASRPCLEYHVRKRVLNLANVELVDRCKTKRLMFNKHGEGVTGVLVERRDGDVREEAIEASLVVDASGRGSKASQWYREMGFDTPEEEKIGIDVGYATRVYRRRPNDLKNGKLLCILPSGANSARGGCLVPMEGDRWICTLSGWGGDHASADEQSFTDFAKRLASTELADVLERLEPEGDIITYKYPFSLRRHYSRLSRHPEGLLVLGDAVCSFNPIFGQGMTSTCCQAASLDKTLEDCHNHTAVAKQYYRQAARFIERAWSTAAAADFEFPTTTGEKPLFVDLLNGYVRMIHIASHRDATVYRSFLKVTNLMSSPITLFRPSIMTRVVIGCARELLKGCINRRQIARVANGGQQIQPESTPT